MRISIEIDEAILRDAMALTGEKNRSPALAKAVTEFVRRQKAREFGRLIRAGAFDYPGVVAESSPGDESDPGNPVPPLIED
ncbi:MAG: type II toxin-antitoxin system VapB family antitoxin [Chthoniobacteraceae bacterium]